jgi:hypothetical protein
VSAYRYPLSKRRLERLKVYLSRARRGEGAGTEELGGGAGRR